MGPEAYPDSKFDPKWEVYALQLRENTPKVSEGTPPQEKDLHLSLFAFLLESTDASFLKQFKSSIRII